MSTHKVRVTKELETGLPEPGSWYYTQGIGSFELLVFFLCKIQPLFPGGSAVKKRLPTQETWILSLGQEDPLEKEMANCSSILAWRIPWTEEPGRLVIELQRVGYVGSN